MVLSLSPGPAPVEEHEHLAAHANLWRMTGDFWDEWEKLYAMFERCYAWQEYVQPGAWPDCDMLPLGRIGKHFGQERATLFTPDEQKTMMTLWCIFGSPLMLGAELTKLDDWTLSLLQNKKLLRLENGHFVSRQVLRSKEKCVWAAVDPQTGERYVALFNFSETAKTIHISPAECAAAFPEGWVCPEEGTWEEVWSGNQSDKIGGEVAPHGALLFHRS